jgi:pyrroloquinoline quinone (PQQ) biosynthesis protein C
VCYTRAMSQAKEQLDALRRRIVSPLPLIQHPVVQARINGELTLDQIRKIEVQHYYEARFFSTFVLNTIKSCNDDIETRKTMAENWVSEATGKDDHATLILRLLDALGVPREVALQAEPAPGMAAWHLIQEQITSRHGFVEAVASLWIGEPEYPPVARALYKAYRDVYKLPSEALETYNTHAEHDPEHGNVEESIVLAAVERDPSLLPRLERICREAWWGYVYSFDGYWQAAIGRHEFWSGVGTTFAAAG